MPLSVQWEQALSGVNPLLLGGMAQSASVLHDLLHMQLDGMVL
jgi:hypothetical protein